MLAAVLAVVALYCLYTARRLDRLHARIDAAAAALDAQLRKRCDAVAAAGRRAVRESAADASHAARVGARREVAGLASRPRGRRERAVDARSHALVDERPRVFLSPSQAAVEVHDEALRAAIARRFYNDTVRDALVVRDRRVVRWLAPGRPRAASGVLRDGRRGASDARRFQLPRGLELRCELRTASTGTGARQARHGRDAQGRRDHGRRHARSRRRSPRTPARSPSWRSSGCPRTSAPRAASRG